METFPALVYFRVTGSVIKLDKVPCNADWTWFRFLKENCKLDIKPDSTLRVSTLRTGLNGWEAQLGDTVKDFVKKFTYVRKVYTIRIKQRNTKLRCVPGLVNVKPSKASPKNSKLNITSNVGRSLSTPKSVSSIISPDMTKLSEPKNEKTANRPASKKMKLKSDPNFREIPNSKGQQDQFGAAMGPTTEPELKDENFSGKSPLETVHDDESTRRIGNAPSQWPEEDYFIGHGPVDDNDNIPLRNNNDDALSQGTTSSMEEIELDKDGIDNKEIKPTVMERLGRNFDNGTMLRIQDELMQLVRNGRWHRLTARAPRTGHLLQDMFRILN